MYRNPLTPTQQRLLDFLREKMQAGEPLPTYREIGSKFGWTSTGTVRDHFRALARKGYIQLSQGRSRAVCLNERRPVAAQVPIVGRIVAGTPVESEQSREEHVLVPSEWACQGQCFAVRVSGDSMKDAAILDGDIVVAKAQALASVGDIVVATLNGETTLKRLTRRGARWFLTPENRHYRPIPIQTDSAVIQGVMVGLLRSEPSRKSGLVFSPASKITRRMSA
jgi:repressor LexA